MTNQIPQTVRQPAHALNSTSKAETKVRTRDEMSEREDLFSGVLMDLDSEAERYIARSEGEGVDKAPLTLDLETDATAKSERSSQNKDLLEKSLSTNVGLTSLFRAAILEEKKPPQVTEKTHLSDETVKQPLVKNGEDKSAPSTKASGSSVSGARVAVPQVPESQLPVPKVPVIQVPELHVEQQPLSSRQASMQVEQEREHVQSNSGERNKPISVDRTEIVASSTPQLRKDQVALMPDTKANKERTSDHLPLSQNKEQLGEVVMGHVHSKKDTASFSNRAVRQLPVEKNIETVSVIENSKIKYYPADIEQHSWKQIGQKIIQSIGNAQTAQDSSMLDQLAGNDPDKSGVSKTIKHLKIQLKPENLGTVDVKLTMSNGSLEVALVASDKQLAGRLSQQSHHLSKQLRAAGLLFEISTIQLVDIDPLISARAASNSGNDNAAQSFNGQKQSQTNNSFGHSGDQRSDQHDEGKNGYDQNEEVFKPSDQNNNPHGSIML